MATARQCHGALTQLADRLAEIDPAIRGRHLVDRTMECTLTDLDISFHGHLEDGSVQSITQGKLPDAQIKLALSSDDLLSLTAGQLNLASAWAAGRIRVDASVMDLLRLRTLL